MFSKQYFERLRMFFLFLLLSSVASSKIIPKDDFSVEIENGILNRVISLQELDLSNMNLTKVKKTAFKLVDHIQSLKLDNNSIRTLPKFTFQNLTNLEHLSLAHNKLGEDTVKFLFLGLEKLKTLDVSYNPNLQLKRGLFHGLSNKVNIITLGNKFEIMSTMLFNTPLEKPFTESKGLKLSENVVDDHVSIIEKKNSLPHQQPWRESGSGLRFPEKYLEGKNYDGNYDDGDGEDDDENEDNVRLMLCCKNGIVTSLEELQEDDKLNNECVETTVTFEEIDLSGLGIKGFDKDWYKLKIQFPAVIILSNNNIAEITKEFLNDLPENLFIIILDQNKVQKINSNVIRNQYLTEFNLQNNKIVEIEDDAFTGTKIEFLNLNGNRLEKLNLTNLPSTLLELYVKSNLIKYISAGVFKNLKNLRFLDLDENKITSLQSEVFEGLNSLLNLQISKNWLSDIEPGAFKHLEKLMYLRLNNNKISKLREGVFQELINLSTLDLSYNKITKVTAEMFNKLPDSLQNLQLEFNGIKSIDPGTFIKVPTYSLNFEMNNITKIPLGAFDLPKLTELRLNRNNVTIAKPEFFKGLPGLKYLLLSSTNLRQINKGAFSNLNLIYLDISKNPISSLKKGALSGLKEKCSVHIHDNRIESIQGGVFENL